MKQRVDLFTIAGLGMLLVPLLTMWHEIGGHAAACVVQGGHISTLGAFYVDCDPISPTRDLVVASAGVAVNILLACIVYRLWLRATSDMARLILWLIWVGEGFVAAGYFCFSGVSGFGDLGTGPQGSFAHLPYPWLIRILEIAIGVPAYILLVQQGIRSLRTMLGGGPETNTSRRRIAHGYYATAGIVAVLVGLLNPVGIVITILSAAASSFGGLAGFISIGFAGNSESPKDFQIKRQWLLILAGMAVTLAFAIVLGPSRHFGL